MNEEKLLGDNIIYPTIKPDRLVTEEQSRTFSCDKCFGLTFNSIGNLQIVVCGPGLHSTVC